MSESTGIVQCVVCAWRENCQKKYSIQPTPTHRCPDFERDLAFKGEGEEPNAASGKNTTSGKKD